MFLWKQELKSEDCPYSDRAYDDMRELLKLTYPGKYSELYSELIDYEIGEFKCETYIGECLEELH